MMDAISFVLGVRSVHLRSSNLKDLIYRGRVMTHEADSETETRSDPTMAYVMAIYEKSNKDVLQLKRTITSSGGSEYRINGKVVSASQYSLVLKEENILIKAKNFLVFQGDVEQIASQSAADLTRMIEVISGSEEFREEYERLKTEREGLHGETTSLFSRKRTLNGELKQYKEQTAEAKLFEAKLQEKSDTIVTQHLFKLFHIDKSLEGLNSKKAVEEGKLIGLKKALKECETEYKTVSSENAREFQAAIKSERALESKRIQVDAAAKDLIPLKAEKGILVSKLSTYKKRIAEIASEVERQEQAVESINSQISSVRSAQKNLEKASKKSQRSLPVESGPEYELLRQEFLKQGGDLEAGIVAYSEELKQLNTRLEATLGEKSALEHRSSDLEFRCSQKGKTLKDVTHTLNETLDELSNQRSQLDTLRTDKEQFYEKKFELNAKLKEVLEQLGDLNASQRESNKERKLRENVSRLKRLFPGVQGLVHDLCRPSQKRFETAVATVLGRNFDAVIVDSLEVAEQCIAHLKECRLGVASFIPIDSVEAQLPNPALRGLGESVRPTIDCVKYEPELERAIHYVCGSSVICDDLETARDVRWNHRINCKAVTLGGSLIHKAGLMTGGALREDGRKWNKNEAASLNLLKDDLKARLDDLSKGQPSEVEEKQMLDRVTELESALPSLRSQRAEIERAVRDLESEIRYQSKKMLEVESGLSELQEEISGVSGSQKELKMQISGLQNQVYGSFLDKYGFKVIDEYEAPLGLAFHAQANENSSKFSKQLTQLQNRLDFESERLEVSRRRLNNLEKDRSEFEDRQTTLEATEESVSSKIDLLESELEIAIEECNKTKSNNANKQRYADSKQERINELKADISSCNKSLIAIEQEVAREAMERYMLLRNCKMQRLALPLTSGTIDTVPVGETDETPETSNLVADYSKLHARYREEYSSSMETELREKIISLTQELDSLTPNVKAVERLHDVEDRVGEVDGDFQKSRHREAEVLEEFNQIKQARYASFMRAFNHISGCIDEVYKELTKSGHSPLGGSAYLTLEDEDEPYAMGIKYHAMPPMKRFRDMEFLSGGEKTIAALALLFSIHSFQPSPFFVLDEVDAALDNANVNKIATYLSKRASSSFQFIVISLKSGLFERSESLVGIYREQSLNSSKTLTLDLRAYPEGERAG